MTGADGAFTAEEVNHTGVALLSDVDLAGDPSESGFSTAEDTPTIGGLLRQVLRGGANEEIEEFKLVCGSRAATFGTEVDQMPDNGRGFKLFDSAPGSVTPRDFYLTGFDDGCARQFTAALAMLGSPRMHELVRYDPMRTHIAYSDVDVAYERVKTQVCRVAVGEPCGENRLSNLERSTAFLTIYETFGSSGNRVEILLHKGDVTAREYAAN